MGEKLEKYYVYWVHEPEDYNILSEGYVGITKSLNRRAREHKNKGTVFTPLVAGSKQYCKEIEYKLRPEAHIGLNRNPGGMIPVITERNREINRQRMLTNNPMKALRHNGGTFKKGVSIPNTPEQNRKISEGKKGFKNPNYGKPETANRLNKLGTCVLCGAVTNLGNIKRWHGDRCRHGLRKSI